jgi:hypothetical protein
MTNDVCALSSVSSVVRIEIGFTPEGTERWQRGGQSHPLAPRADQDGWRGDAFGLRHGGGNTSGAGGCINRGACFGC